MSSVVERQNRNAISEASRAALREKIMKIVGAVPAVAAEPARSIDLRSSLVTTHCIALFVDPAQGDFDADEFVTTIRKNYPQLKIVLVGRPPRSRDLPCEFGGRPPRLLAQESPIARAAASRWAARDRGPAPHARKVDTFDEHHILPVGGDAC